MRKSLGWLLLSFIPWAIAEVFWGASRVQAGETCNYINNSLYMAQAHLNTKNIWVSQGWWVIEPGQCVVYADNVSTHFKIAEDQAAPRPTLPQSIQTDLCVVNDRFTVYQANDAAVCENQDGLMTPFTAIGQQKEVLQEFSP